jgi:hypothetical protein
MGPRASLDDMEKSKFLTGGRRKLLNEEIHGVYSSPSIIRMNKSTRMRWAGHVARMGTKRNACRILVGRLERRRPLGRPRRTWLDNIKMYFKEIGWYGMDWIDLAQDRDLWRGSFEHGNEPSGPIKCYEILE